MKKTSYNFIKELPLNLYIMNIVSVLHEYKGKQELFLESKPQILAKLVEFAKGVGTIVNDKSKYTDWLSKPDIRSQLAVDIKVYLNKNSYPPEYIKSTYDKVMEQIDNYKKMRSKKEIFIKI